MLIKLISKLETFFLIKLSAKHWDKKMKNDLLKFKPTIRNGEEKVI